MQWFCLYSGCLQLQCTQMLQILAGIAFCYDFSVDVYLTAAQQSSGQAQPSEVAASCRRH